MTTPTPMLTEQVIMQLQRELAAAQERYDTLWALHDAGSVPYDLEIDRLRKRAEKAEAERDSLKRHAEAMAEELQWIACRYDDSKSTRECAADAYEMKSAAAQALHAYRATQEKS